ncbi:MAG TPA: ABC transporter permease subunit [Saprospiraceae bacterium]|nr:ABC transporter permease subunit [Saprospiraceae bacterium]HQW26052.1 ABC transporter permease subunit [Saprospiraceae bacterium]
MKFIGGIEEGTSVQKVIFGILGFALVILGWIALTSGGDPVITSGILPSPFKVITAFPELFNENELLRNTGVSIGLNLAGYMEAILITIPVGFVIGLIKYARWGFQRQIDAIRYIPLTAVTGLFIVWFGIDTDMKIHFLAFGILIYILPVMIQRIDEVDDVYIKTVHTLGATDWQLLKTVYMPSVVSRLSDDIRVLTAISWTYIIVAESINSNQGGLGALIYSVGLRQGSPDKVFALLIIIMAIGIVQDKLFVKMDKELFPFKYQAKEAVKSSRLENKGLISVISDYVLVALGWIVISIYLMLMINELAGFLGDSRPLSYLFGSTVWVVHLIFICILVFKLWKWYQQRTDQVALKVIASKTKGI